MIQGGEVRGCNDSDRRLEALAAPPCVAHLATGLPPGSFQARGSAARRRPVAQPTCRCLLALLGRSQQAKRVPQAASLCRRRCGWKLALRASNHEANITQLRPLSLGLPGRLQHQFAAAAFHCWRSRAAEQLSRLEKLSRAGSHWWHSRCSAAFALWHERAIHTRQKRVALLHAALAFKAGKLVPAFVAWKEHAAWRLHSKSIVARSLQVC